MNFWKRYFVIIMVEKFLPNNYDVHISLNLVISLKVNVVPMVQDQIRDFQLKMT